MKAERCFPGRCIRSERKRRATEKMSTDNPYLYLAPLAVRCFFVFNSGHLWCHPRGRTNATCCCFFQMNCLLVFLIVRNQKASDTAQFWRGHLKALHPCDRCLCHAWTADLAVMSLKYPKHTLKGISLSLVKSSRFPEGQNSMMKKYELSSWMKSVNSIMFLCLHSCINLSSRLQNVSVSGFLCTCFTATVVLSLVSTARHTVPKPPFPKTFFSSRFSSKCFPRICNFKSRKARTRFRNDDILDDETGSETNNYYQYVGQEW